MSVVIVVAGVVGLAVAGVALVELCVDAARRRHYVDIGVALAVVALVVWLLIAYGDRLLR